MTSFPRQPANNTAKSATGASLKIPTFNTNTFRVPRIKTTTISSNGNATNRPMRLPLPQNVNKNGVIIPNGKTTIAKVPRSTTTKISVGGKVIDVDVLTKLQSKNGIISFNASKDLLSNLAVTKLVGGKTFNHQNLQQAQQQTQQQQNNKQISVTVFSTQGKKNPEKFLLPKTTQPSHVEVKKFAPEMNGLLTALKTARKLPVTQGEQTNAVKGGYMLNKPLLAPFTVSVIKDQQQKRLIAITTTSSSTATSINKTQRTRSIIALSHNKPTTLATASTTRPIVHLQQKQHFNNKRATSQLNNKTNVITSHHGNKSSIMTSKPISAIVENRAYKSNKVILENNKKANLKIKSLLLKDLMTKKANREKDFTKIDGFDQLYNEAVNNVLKLETNNNNNNNKDEETKKKILKDIEVQFQHYLDKPMEIEKKIEEGLFKFCRKRPSPSSSTSGTPNETKRRKLIDEEMLTAYLKSDSISPVFLKTPTVKVNDNRNFFEQFLTDRAKFPKQFVPAPPPTNYISPIEYPWFYPTYFHPHIHPANQQFAPKRNPPQLIKSSTPTTPKDIKTFEPIVEESERVIGVKTRSSSGIREAKRNHPLNNKTIKDNKSKKINKETPKNINKRKSPTEEKVTSPNIKNEKFTSRNHLMKPKPQVSVQRMSASEKRFLNKDKLKFRYSLRQRAKALKKATKIASLEKVTQPKLILKKFDERTCSKKEFFLSLFGLRRVLKRVPQNEN